MTYIVDRHLPDGTDISAGLVPGWTNVTKFGRHLAVGTAFVPVTIGGIYQAPQPAGATTLRIKAGGNANDAAAGTGARQVTLQGLDATGVEITEAVDTAGASASSPTSASFVRLYRAWVSNTGNYPALTDTTGGHDADIVIENSGGGTDWLTIDATNYARGQSDVAWYTVPLGSTAYISSIAITVEPSGGSTKPADILLVRRESILDTAAPYQAPRSLYAIGSLQGTFIQRFAAPIGPISALTDVGFLARAASGTPSVECNMELMVKTA